MRVERTMRFLTAGLLALVPLHAAEAGFYGSLRGMAVVPSDADGSFTTSSGLRIGGSVALETGFGVAGALGYETDGGLQLEAEVGRRSTDVDGVEVDRDVSALLPGVVSRSFPANGKVRSLSVMVNACYSADMPSFQPYFGAGIGFVRHSGEITYAAGMPLQDFDARDTVFAYQGMLGVGFRLSENAEVRLGYRLFASQDPDLERLTASYVTHNFEAGVTFRF